MSLWFARHLGWDVVFRPDPFPNASGRTPGIMKTPVKTFGMTVKTLCDPDCRGRRAERLSGAGRQELSKDVQMQGGLGSAWGIERR